MRLVFLFLAPNIAIALVLSVSMLLLGVEAYLDANGLNPTSLLIVAVTVGFGASFFSLAVSNRSAQKATGVPVIDTPAVNAFATGMSSNSSLVAVSSGLLQ